MCKAYEKGKYPVDDDSVIKIKERLKEAREKAEYTQKTLSEKLEIGDGGGSGGRTTLTSWESPNNGVLPKVPFMMRICNLLHVDMDWLLGASNVESQDCATIAKTINTSKDTVEQLIKHPEYGSLLDCMAHDGFAAEMSRRIEQLGMNLVLESVITTAFTPQFACLIRRKFDTYYYHTFPIDMSPENYAKYLEKQFSYGGTFDSRAFIERNFLFEGKGYIYNRYKNGEREFYALPPMEQYKVIISSIAEITYDYFMSLQTIELSKQRLAAMFMDIVEKAMEQEAEKSDLS